MKTRAMIFDLDGTLGDTLPLCIEAFKKSIEPIYGKELDEKTIIDTFGPSEEGTVLSLIPDRFDGGIHSYWRWYEILHEKYPDPFPGIRDVLSLLRDKNVRLGLVTGKAEKSAMISLGRFGLGEFFSAMAFGNPHESSKDEGILSVLAQFGIAPDEAVYVGDTVTDIESARKAGVRVISAAWASTAEYERLKAHKPDDIFTSIQDFASYVQAL